MNPKDLTSLRIGNWVLLGFIAIMSIIALSMVLIFIPQVASAISGLGAEMPILTRVVLAMVPWGYITIFIVGFAFLIHIEIVDKSGLTAFVAKIVGLFSILGLGLIIYAAMMQPLFKIIGVLTAP